MRRRGGASVICRDCSERPQRHSVTLMEPKAFARTAKILRYILLSVAAFFLASYLLVALLRIGYPFELEWMEGASVDQVLRILSGGKLYVAPSLEFIPFIYTPLYFYASAVVSKIVGSGFLPLRLLSLASSGGCFFIIFLIVKRETKSAFAALLAPSLFAATFVISGAWFDIGRADSLFLLLLLAGLYLVRFRQSPISYILAGVSVSLAFLTKQMALIVFVPMAAYLFLVDRRRCAYFIGPVLLIVAASTVLLDWIHGGWYTYYVFKLPAQHALLKSMWLYFWSVDIMSKLSIAFVMSIFCVFSQAVHSKRGDCLFYFLIFIGMLAASWLSRAHPGGYLNVLFPAYAALSILFGLAVHAAVEFIQALSSDRRKMLEPYLYLVCLVQFALLLYNPFAQIPNERDREAGRAFIKTMAELPGDILMPYHGYLPSLAGKKCCAHKQAISDILKAHDGPIKAKLMDEISRALRERRFDCVILNAPWFPELTERHYVKRRLVFDKKDVFWPATGFQTRPELIFVAKTDDVQ